MARARAQTTEFVFLTRADGTVCSRTLISFVWEPRARDGEITINSLSRHEHRTDINTEIRTLSIMVSRGAQYFQNSNKKFCLPLLISDKSLKIKGQWMERSQNHILKHFNPLEKMATYIKLLISFLCLLLKTAQDIRLLQLSCCTV